MHRDGGLGIMDQEHGVGSGEADAASALLRRMEPGRALRSIVSMDRLSWPDPAQWATWRRRIYEIIEIGHGESRASKNLR